jgi:streptogramin lyase
MSRPIITKTAALLALALVVPFAYADQGSFTNSGGSGSVGSAVSLTSSVASPPGTLTLTCPVVTAGNCAGGNFSYQANDGTSAINAGFTSGTYLESCSGGGKGGHITCSYSFMGYISGTWTVNGLPQAISGVSRQIIGVTNPGATGTTAFSSAYTPFYYSDSEQIHRSDDLLGTNQVSFGRQGSGVGAFYGAYGIALDSAGRIYVADTYNCRIVRIDDMRGTNWNTYGGACGSGVGQFYDPSGIALDGAGRIYVMDTGNSRLVRIDDMNGTNWITYGAPGSAVGQFAPYLTSVTLDPSGRIYVADTGNLRIVRIDDMNGANWTALTQSQPVNGATYYFQSPVAVAVDSAGRIYVADNEYYAPAVVRVDNMSGANWTSIYVSPSGSGGLHSIAVDNSGTVFGGGGGAKVVDNMAGVLTSSSAIGPLGSYYVFGVTPLPLPSPRPSALSLTPSNLSFTQNVGGTSPPQPVTISNFGGSPLDIWSISTSGEFSETNNCPAALNAGSACTVNVTFTPAGAGTVSGILAINDDSGNLGSSQTVALSGTGGTPVTVLPTALSFGTVAVGRSSLPKTVTLTNHQTTSLSFSSIVTSAGFGISSNTCGSSIGAGATCKVGVTFSPIASGAVTGTLTFTDNASNSPQTVSLTGTAR